MEFQAVDTASFIMEQERGWWVYSVYVAPVSPATSLWIMSS